MLRIILRWIFAIEPEVQIAYVTFIEHIHWSGFEVIATHGEFDHRTPERYFRRHEWPNRGPRLVGHSEQQRSCNGDGSVPRLDAQPISDQLFGELPCFQVL